MSMYGKYKPGEKAWPTTDCSKDIRLTSQADKDEVDINKIMKKIEAGKMVNQMAREPFYGDVSEFNGLADAIIKVQDAKELFMGLSADIRERFQNDPVELIEFLENPENLDEAVKLGIVNKRPEDAGQPASIPPAETGGK